MERILRLVRGYIRTGRTLTRRSRRSGNGRSGNVLVSLQCAFAPKHGRAGVHWHGLAQSPRAKRADRGVAAQ